MITELNQKPTALIDEKEFARILGVKPATVRRWRCGYDTPLNCPPFIKIGRSVRYRISDVEQFIQANVHA